jgi:hypothetical protein
MAFHLDEIALFSQKGFPKNDNVLKGINNANPNVNSDC